MTNNETIKKKFEEQIFCSWKTFCGRIAEYLYNLLLFCRIFSWWQKNRMDYLFFFFARYHLSCSAAIGWLSWRLIKFLDFVNLVACIDGVITYGHGQTVKKKRNHRVHLRHLTWTDHPQRLGIHLFLHNLKKQWTENSMWKWSWLLFSAYLKRLS